MLYFRGLGFHLLLITTIVAVSHSEVLHCKFAIISNWDNIVGNPYACDAKSINFLSRVVIDRINGNHNRRHGNNDVTALKIIGQNCQYFPIGVGGFFPNIEAIAVQHSNLMVIRKRDLKSFPKLRSLSLHNNFLTSLEFGLFVHNPKLQTVSFYQNYIEAVGNDLFNNLNDLQEVHFNHNNCTSEVAETRNQLTRVKESILDTCSSNEDLKYILELEESRDDFEKKYVDTERHNKELQKQMSTKDEEIRNLKSQLNNLNKLNGELQTCKTKKAELENALATKSAEVNQKNKELDKKNAELSKKDAELASKDAELQTANTNFRNCNTNLDSKTSQLKACLDGKQALDDSIVGAVAEVKSKEEEIKNLVSDLQTVEQNCNKTKSDLEDCLARDDQECVTKIDLKCKFEKADENYICFAENLNIFTENTQISKITGTHTDSVKSVRDVTIFSVENQNMQYFPKNFNGLFPNLKQVEIISSNLRKITKLNNLKMLKIYGNDIEAIDEKSFVGSPQLTTVMLSGNKIQRIPPGLFKSCNKIMELNLENNRLTSISISMFNSITDLRLVMLGSNQIGKIDWVAPSSTITWLDLAGNVCIDGAYPSIEMNKLAEIVAENCST